MSAKSVFLVGACCFAGVSNAQNVVREYRGDEKGDGFGVSVAGGEDLDGDGSPDAIVGAPDDDNAGGGTGAIRALSGASGKVLYVVDGTLANEGTGVALSFVGDLDGDGVADFASGAPIASPAGIPAGRVRAFSGRTGVLIRIWDGDLGSQFGRAVRGVGDLDHDGVPDVVVGAPLGAGPAGAAGWVRVFSGATGAILRTYFGVENGSRFGFAVDSTVDADGDGILDLVIGAPDEFSGYGTARVILTGSGATFAALWGITAGARFGYAVSGSEPLFPSGAPIIVVGAPGTIGPNGMTGAVEGFSGTFGKPIFLAYGHSPGDGFGTVVEIVPDMYGHPYNEIAIGSPDASPGGRISAGRIDVFRGNDMLRLFSIEGTEPDQFLGSSISAAGDLNGDGLGELLYTHDRGAWYSSSPRTGSARIVTLASEECPRIDAEYGVGCGLPLPYGAPHLAFAGCAASGAQTSLSLTNVPGSGVAIWFAGSTMTDHALGWGCSVLVAPLVPIVSTPLAHVLGNPSSSGFVSITGILPPHPPLGRIHFQVFVPDASIPSGLRASNGLALSFE